MDTLTNEIRHFLIVRSGSVDDALTKACRDIALLHKQIWQLEDRLLAASRDQSAGYQRRAPAGPVSAIAVEPPASVTDEWVATGRETEGWG
jgi:hypothetical protein